MQVLDSSGANQTGMYSLTNVRIINGWVKLRVSAGSDNADYVIRLILQDTNTQTFVLSNLLQVRKLLPS
jgi:hypothetical protein